MAKIPPPPSPKGVYYPKSKYSKPKSAGQDEFIIKGKKDYYKGLYVKTFDKKYFAGKSPLETGIELEKVSNHSKGHNEIYTVGIGLLGAALGGFFKKKPTMSEKQNGIAKRYFVQDMNNNKIAETDKATYLETKLTVPNRRFAEVDWNIQGPAEDVMFGKYMYEGSESKNKKTIQALEKTIPGISAFITDYKLLVESVPLPPNAVIVGAPVIATQNLAVPQSPLSQTQTFVEPDADTKLENDRKANFDYRKK